MTTWADVARLRLVAQGLVGEPRSTASDVVRHLTCLQAQDFSHVRAAVAIRTAQRSVAGVNRALDDGSVVRSWPMRGTLHLVPAEDLGWMLDLTRDRMRRQASRRHAELGLTAELRDRVETLTRALLTGTGLSRTCLIAAWRDSGLELDGPIASHLIGALAIDQVIVFGPVDDQTGSRQQQLRLTSDWIARPRRLDRDAAIAEWLLRYLSSHGPATIKDFCWWTKLGVSEVRPVQAAVTRQLEPLEVDGVALWHAPGLRERRTELGRDGDRPLLVPGFDEILLGYGDRSATLPTEHVDLVVPGHNSWSPATTACSSRSCCTAAGRWRPGADRRRARPRWRSLRSSTCRWPYAGRCPPSVVRTRWSGPPGRLPPWPARPRRSRPARCRRSSSRWATGRSGCPARTGSTSHGSG